MMSLWMRVAISRLSVLPARASACMRPEPAELRTREANGLLLLPNHHMAIGVADRGSQGLKAFLTCRRLVTKPNFESDPFQFLHDAAHLRLVFGRVADVNVKLIDGHIGEFNGEW